MFGTSRTTKSYRDSFSHRAGKATTKKKDRCFREKELNRSRKAASFVHPTPAKSSASSSPISPNLNSAIVTISVGHSQRLFAAHEDVLSKSPFFFQACRAQFFNTSTKRIELPHEEPEVFSAVLEFLYKGDYSPKIAYDKKRSSWYLEDGGVTAPDGTVQHTQDGRVLLKDTLIYCSAHSYALPALQRLSLKKQGLQSGVQCSTILASARYAYDHTPASDSKLRAHYLALIIRSRSTFKRSGTMQMEMQAGGTALFFDLFVAMVNHLDDITSGKSPR